MIAITETPAKTPSPIGSTCICLPGGVKAAVVGEGEVSAAAPATVPLGDALDDSEVPLGIDAEGEMGEALID